MKNGVVLQEKMFFIKNQKLWSAFIGYKPTLPKEMVRSHLVLEISRAQKFLTREISSFEDPSGCSKDMNVIAPKL